MFNTGRIRASGWALLVLAALSGCTAAPAIKVQCESTLRPINPASLEHREP